MTTERDELPPISGLADDTSTSQSTTLSRLVKRLLGNVSPREFLAQQHFCDDENGYNDSETPDFYVHTVPPSHYEEDEGARDFETVSSISRMSAMTDVILLSDPAFGTGRILSLEPPQPDEETVDRPMHPPMRSIVTMGPVKDDPSFETIMFGDGVMKARRCVDKTVPDKSTEGGRSSCNDGTEGVAFDLRFPLRKVVLLLALAFIVGGSAAYVLVIFENDERDDNTSTSPELSANYNEESITDKDADISWTLPPTSSVAPSSLFLTKAPSVSPMSLPADATTLKPTAPSTALREFMTDEPTTRSTVLPTSPQRESYPPTRAPSSAESVKNIMDALSVIGPEMVAMTQIPGSPQNMAYQFLLETTPLGVYPQYRILQRYAMAVFYYVFNGDNWENNSLWLDHENECFWYSNYPSPCNSEGELVRLHLSRNNLVGSIPDELSLLSNLVEIHLGGNHLVEQIPTFLGAFQKLERLDLSWTALDGQIPPSLGNALSLQRINLVGTSINGPVPSELGNLIQLEDLQLAKTRVTGSMPTAICALGLQELWADCDKVECPCCTYCCYSGNIEYCQYIGNNF